MRRPYTARVQRISSASTHPGVEARQGLPPRKITWLAVVVLGVAASLAATGGAFAGGTAQFDGNQTLVSLGDPFDPADDVLDARVR